MTYYEKRGRRYYPVAEDITINAYPEGDYLISVKPGYASSRRTIQPDHAAIDFATFHFTEILIDEIHKHMQLKLGPEFSKEDQMKLFKFVNSLGASSLYQDSAVNIADNAMAKWNELIKSNYTSTRNVTIESDELIIKAFKYLSDHYSKLSGKNLDEVIDQIKEDMALAGDIPAGTDMHIK
jgi:ribosomal protein L12E/L44/L45/RPP1/RPP2